MQRTPHATLPYAMMGQDKVTSLPLLINMGRYRRRRGSGRKKERRKGTREQRREFFRREKDFEKNNDE